MRLTTLRSNGYSGNFGCAMVAQGLCLQNCESKTKENERDGGANLLFTEFTVQLALAGLAFKPWGAGTFFKYDRVTTKAK